MNDAKIPRRCVPLLLGATLAGAPLRAEVPLRENSEHHARTGSSIDGEVASVDLGRRSLTLKVENPGGEPREIDLPLDDQSRIVSGGRTLSLDQVRSGARVFARCASPDARGRRTCWVHIRRTRPARVPPS